MSGHNALERLHGARLLLRRANIRSLDEYRAATPEQLELLRRAPEIAKAVEAGHAGALAALFVDEDLLTWQIAGYSSHPRHKGISLIFRDDPEGHRAARRLSAPPCVFWASCPTAKPKPRRDLHGREHHGCGSHLGLIPLANSEGASFARGLHPDPWHLVSDPRGFRAYPTTYAAR